MDCIAVKPPLAAISIEQPQICIQSPYKLLHFNLYQTATQFVPKAGLNLYLTVWVIDDVTNSSCNVHVFMSMHVTYPNWNEPNFSPVQLVIHLYKPHLKYKYMYMYTVEIKS